MTKKNNNISTPITRMLELDALRGFAAIGVLLFHYTSYFDTVFNSKTHPPFVFPWIPYRLQLFSLISGFAILMILEKTQKPLDFIVARFSRLYPCYFVAVLLTTSLTTLFPLKTDFPLSGKIITWPMFFSNLTMLQSWFNFADIDGVYWFLAPELTFYLIVFILFSFKQLKHIEWLGLIGLLCVVVNARYGQIGELEIPKILITSRILCFWQFFYAGMIFYHLKSKGESWLRHASIALCFIAENLITDNITTIFFFSICILMFYLFTYGKLSWINQKPLIFLGTISYSLYLIHQNIGYIIIGRLDILGISGWLRFLIPTAIAILIATAMTYLIEKPVMKFIRTKYKELKN